MEKSKITVAQITISLREAEQGTRLSIACGKGGISEATFYSWAYENKVTLDFSLRGKSTDNPYIESFNGSLEMRA